MDIEHCISLQLDTYLPISKAAKLAHVDQSVILQAIESGRIKAAMTETGAYLVNQRDLQAPLRKCDTPEWKAVEHLKGVEIGIRQAAEKYNISSQTISQWIEKGFIRRLSGETLRGQRVLVDEADVAYCAAVYKANPGQGKRIFNPDGTPYRKAN